MTKKLTEKDSVFDGYCHRPFDENMDGWRNAAPNPDDYDCVSSALGVLQLFDDLKNAKIRIWELEKELEQYRKVGKFFDGMVTPNV